MATRRSRGAERHRVETSALSIVREPDMISVRRKREMSSVDLPLPVRPQMRICEPGEMERVIFLSTRAETTGVEESEGEPYATPTLRNSMAPLQGYAESGGSWDSVMRFSDGVEDSKS